MIDAACLSPLPALTTVRTMPQDLKVIDFIDDKVVPRTWPRAAYVGGIYNLVQRVYKCMLTEPGDDEDDPTFGGGIRSALQAIPGQQVDKARLAASAMLKKVKSDLLVNYSEDPEERLVDLQLSDIKFDYETTGWRLAVTVVTVASQATIGVQG
jgi:hypothetical protein